MEYRVTAALFILFIYGWKRWCIEVTPLERPKVVRGGMAVGLSTVDEHAVAFAQLLSLLLIGKFSLARQNDKAKKRHQILSLGYMWVNSLQRADLLQMDQGCPGKG